MNTGKVPEDLALDLLKELQAIPTPNAQTMRKVRRRYSGILQNEKPPYVLDTARALIGAWARSTDRWQRRTALVSTIALNRPSLGGTGDIPRTLAICDILAGDRDHNIVLALSWALRELIRHAPTAIRTFLSTHTTILHPRVLREVTNKLTHNRKTGPIKKK